MEWNRPPRCRYLMGSAERQLLEEYLTSGKLMQVATISEAGAPAVCNVWYNVRFRPDCMCFVSRRDREHSENIRRNGNVAGSVVALSFSGLGDKVRGVTFKGQAEEITGGGREEIAAFLVRWPKSKTALGADEKDYPVSPSRLYLIRVREWVLFDEVNFPDQPRRRIPALT